MYLFLKVEINLEKKDQNVSTTIAKERKVELIFGKICNTTRKNPKRNRPSVLSEEDHVFDRESFVRQPDQ